MHQIYLAISLFFAPSLAMVLFIPTFWFLPVLTQEMHDFRDWPQALGLLPPPPTCLSVVGGEEHQEIFCLVP